MTKETTPNSQVPIAPVEQTETQQTPPIVETTPEVIVEPTPEVVAVSEPLAPPVVAPPVVTPTAAPITTSISPEIERWLSEKSIVHEQEIETLREWYLTEEKGYKDLGLHLDVSPEEFIDFVESAVMSRIESEMGIPKKELEYMCLGRFNQSPRGAANVVSESVGFMVDPANINNSSPRLTLCQGWNNKLLRHTAKPLGTYRTKFGFDETQPQPDENGKCTISVEESSNFVETELSWASKNEKDKLEWIRSIYPNVVSLGDVENSPSILMGSGFVNPTDIRRVRVVVNTFKEGVNKLGVPWGSYSVTDKTFKPTPQNKFFNIWIDPAIAHSIDCGDGSIIEVYGLIKRHFKSGLMEMDACAAFPILKKPITNHTQNIMPQNGQSQVPTMTIPPMIGGMNG